jgi:hypothetical protein
MQPVRKEWLDSIGFLWSSPSRGSSAWTIVQAALTTYESEYGNLNVPRTFAVPSCAPWEAGAWGKKLGKAVNNMRARKGAMEPLRRDWLDSVGFQWRVL